MGRVRSAGDDSVRKFGQHQPLNRQAERYALEGVPISLSTMAQTPWDRAVRCWSRYCGLSRRMLWRPNACTETA